MPAKAKKKKGTARDRPEPAHDRKKAAAAAPPTPPDPVDPASCTHHWEYDNNGCKCTICGHKMLIRSAFLPPE